MKNIMINGSNNQLELAFDNATRATNCAVRRRHTVASRWFRRMHQVVDSARDWRPALPTRHSVAAIATAAPQLRIIEHKIAA
jgi:hypothetical protein